MSGLISRQAAIDALCTPHGILYPIRTVEELPAVQPEKRTDKRTEKHACDLPSVDPDLLHLQKEQAYMRGWEDGRTNLIKQLPSVQPEIVRCKDCKYWMRENISDGYCSEMNIGDCGEDFYCGYAEEHTMEEFMDGQDMGNPEDGSL